MLLLARTITHLDGVDEVDTDVVEGLYAADLAFLQDLYRQVNQRGDTRADVDCPRCGHRFGVDLAGEAARGVDDVGES